MTGTDEGVAGDRASSGAGTGDRPSTGPSRLPLPTHRPSLPPLSTAFVVAAVVAGVALAGWRLDAVTGAALGVISGIVVGITLLLGDRRGPIGGLLRGATVAVSGLLGTLAFAVLALAAYDTFGTRSVLPTALLARIVSFWLVGVGCVAAGAGMGVLRRGTIPGAAIDRAARAGLTAALVVGLAASWALRSLLRYNLDAFGIDPVETVSLLLLARGATTPQVASFAGFVLVLVVLATTATRVVPVEAYMTAATGVDASWIEDYDRAPGIVAAVSLTGLLVASVTVEVVAAWATVLPSPALVRALDLLTTSSALRFVLCVLAGGVALLALAHWLAGADWRRVVEPGAVLLGVLSGPLLAVGTVLETPVIDVVVANTPPDAAQSIEYLIAEFGAPGVGLAAVLSGTVLFAVGLAVLAVLEAFGAIDGGTLGPIVAGAGTALVGLGVAVHTGPGVVGAVVLTLGVLAWWLGSFGRGVGAVAGPGTVTRPEIVHGVGAALVAGCGIVLAAGLFALGDRLFGRVPQTAGVGTLLAVFGVALVVLAVRKRQSRADGTERATG